MWRSYWLPKNSTSLKLIISYLYTSLKWVLLNPAGAQGTQGAQGSQGPQGS